MITQYILNLVPEQDRDNLVTGLVTGLAFGLVTGLVTGLVIGVAFGLAFGLVNIVTNAILPWPYSLFFILFVLMISELLFFMDSRKPNKGENHLTFTLLAKGESLIESLVLIVNTMNVILERNAIITFLQGISPAIMQGIYYLGLLVVVCIGIYGYIWLNSLRYKEKKRLLG